MSRAGEVGGRWDVIVVGGGILGLATARELLSRRRGAGVLLIEKEAGLGRHQTGHNSGVIHSGIYYRPGSAKARTCVDGAERMKRFCAERGVPLAVRGKVIVAVEPGELPALADLHRRAVANRVAGVALVGPERLREIEPHARGVRALHVPGTAVVDFAAVAHALAGEVVERGGAIRTGAAVIALHGDGSERVVVTARGEARTRVLVACAGLQSDRVARLDGARPAERIVPFRGDYHELARRELVRGLIYPVPDPRFPFLGVHLTRNVGDAVEAGPNAVLSLDREGYRRAAFRARDAWATLGYRGFWRLAGRHLGTGLAEAWRSLSRSAFARALARLVPEIRGRDLVAAGCGIRAQALTPAGALADDFVIMTRPRSVHVLNAPSPAATASLAIAVEIADRAEALLT
jgi:L-2-hydroxyglutarate oxidase LhgO